MILINIFHNFLFYKIPLSRLQQRIIRIFLISVGPFQVYFLLLFERLLLILKLIIDVLFQQLLLFPLFFPFLI